VFINNIERGSTKNQKGSIFVAIGGWTLKTLKFRAYDIQPQKGTNSRCFWVERGGGCASACAGPLLLPGHTRSQYLFFRYFHLGLAWCMRVLVNKLENAEFIVASCDKMFKRVHNGYNRTG
jgi:hypothetical protein